MLMTDREQFVFAVAQYEDTLLNHPVVCVPNSDCSGGFGGLSRRWGRRRRWWRGRAVSQEAAPPELIRLTPFCLVVVDGHSPSYPLSSGRLSGSRPACAICSSQGGNSWAPNSLCPSSSLLLVFPQLEGVWALLFWTFVPAASLFAFSFTSSWRLYTLLSSFWGGTPCPLCKITPRFFW